MKFKFEITLDINYSVNNISHLERALKTALDGIGDNISIKSLLEGKKAEVLPAPNISIKSLKKGKKAEVLPAPIYNDDAEFFAYGSGFDEWLTKETPKKKSKKKNNE